MLNDNVSLFLNLFFELTVQLVVLADVDAAGVASVRRIIVLVIVVRSIVRLFGTILTEDVVKETTKKVALVEVEQISIALNGCRRVAVGLTGMVTRSRIDHRLRVVVHGDVLLIALWFAGLFVPGGRLPTSRTLLVEREAAQKFVELLNEIVAVEVSSAFLLLHTVAEAIAIERLSAVAARYTVVLWPAGCRFVQHHVRFVAVRLPRRRRRGNILTG